MMNGMGQTQFQMPSSYRNHLAIKSVFRETGTYNDIFRRAYSSTNVDGYLSNDFKQLVAGASNMSTGYDVDMMASVSNRLLRPQSQINPMTDMGQIANGWGNKRWLFTIEISTDVTGNANIQPERILLNGYTDHPGATMSGAMDPNMRVYFNSVVQLRTVNQQGFGWNGTTTVPSDVSHVIQTVSDVSPYLGQPFQAPYTLLRPYDVVNNINTNFVYSGVDMDVCDLRSTVTGVPFLSSRNNAIAPKYLEKTFQSLLKGYRDPTVGEDDRTIYSSAADLLKENYATKMAFFIDLATNTSYNQLGYVTYGELCKLVPNLDHITTVFFSGNASPTAASAFFGSPERGATTQWSGSDQETMIATIMGSSIPSLMMECLISTITMSITNRTLDRSFSVVIQNVSMFSELVDASIHVPHFIERLKREILADVTYGNTLDVSVNVAASTIEDTWLQISFMGGPSTDYVIPSFSDALISPVIGSNSQALHNLSYSIDGLFNASMTVLDPMRNQTSSLIVGKTSIF